MTKEVMVNAVKAGATIVATSINERIPVDTGELKDNLAVEIATNPKGAIATVGFLDPFMASIAYWVEFGHATREPKTAMQKFFKQRHGNTIGHVPAHPFFRPGIDSSMKEASEAVMEVIGTALESDDNPGATLTPDSDSQAVAA